jgi:hypothetical protein
VRTPTLLPVPGSKCREADGAAAWIGVFGESTGGPGVSGRSNLGSGVEGESTSGDGSHFASEVTALVADATGDNGTPAIFQFKGANVVRIDSAGKGFFNGGTQTGGADVAEFIAFGGPLQPGDVAEIDTELRAAKWLRHDRNLFASIHDARGPARARRRDTCGRACSGYEVRIWRQDDSDIEAAPGAIGEIGGRGAGVYAGRVYRPFH